ncbi:MAG: SDR family oxidoreductase [Candidatus Sericytochromatia bacterium]|nr:SDR family oxidoreductase [Candidatus Tanganyikabacteria bacterium]
MPEAVALVAGASGEIGRAIALALAREGADVALHYHGGRTAAEALAGEIAATGRRALAVRADLAAAALPEGFIAGIEERLGPITRVAYAAGIAREDLAAFASLDDWDEVMRVNLRGAVMLAQAVLPGMLKARRGSLVFVGSEAGMHGSPGLSAYAASKAGLAAFVKSLAVEIGPRGVRANLVSPGPVESAMLGDLPADKREALRARTPLGRLATPEDVAEAVTYLLSDRARFVTGAVLPVNGGLGLF